MTTARFIASGNVLSALFCTSTQSRAREHGLTGVARNSADGRVEVVDSSRPGVTPELESWQRAGRAVARENPAPQEQHYFARL